MAIRPVKSLKVHLSVKGLTQEDKSLLSGSSNLYISYGTLVPLSLHIPKDAFSEAEILPLVSHVHTELKSH